MVCVNLLTNNFPKILDMIGKRVIGRYVVISFGGFADLCMSMTLATFICTIKYFSRSKVCCHFTLPCIHFILLVYFKITCVYVHDT